MADFVHGGWALFVAFGTIISIVLCYWLAWKVSTATTDDPANGEVGTTGHVWDEDLQELNNPLPRWWLYLFFITCIFGMVYILLYPGLGDFKGSLKWSSAGQYEEEVARIDAVAEPLFAGYLAQDIAAVAAIPEAHEMGERLYLNYCSQCHGSDARGGRSFPNLTDNDWLGTGDPAYIKHTILNGRNAIMPAMAAAIGNTEADVEAVAHYVMSLSDSNHDADLAAAGEAKYAVCAGCHGADGQGMAAVGAPNLVDDIWLYGGSLNSVKYAISNGFNNQMPAFEQLLGEGKAHVLAAYIWSLSNPSDDVAQAN